MEQEFIEARSVIPIYYSSVTNTSKSIAFKLSDVLEESSFIPTINNIGDFDPQEWLDYSGTIILVLATYGNGNSPPDGQKFTEWLDQLLKKKEHKQIFSKMDFSIMALGNRSFEHFCGNGNSVREKLCKLGANEIMGICECNSQVEQENASSKFDKWQQSLLGILSQKYQLKKFNKNSLMQKYIFKLTQQDIPHWEHQIQNQQIQKHISQSFLSFSNMKKVQVIKIQQMRHHSQDRSTLWIKMKKPNNMELSPACNISVFPENIRKEGQQKFVQNICIESVKNNGKIPFPSMNLEQLWRLSNFNQKADMNLLKRALRLSNESNQVKQKYDKYLKNPDLLEKEPIRCIELKDTLKPGFQFMVDLGLNTLRPYTLASWNQDSLDLIVSLDPFGLTSHYFKNRPKQIRISPITSTFYIPSGRPIIMIANGSGIAPFRSLTQYLLPRLEQHKVQLILYFGIQNKKIDYYFQSEWEQYEQEGKIKLNIAESRADPEKKVYVQHLLERDREAMKEHLFGRKGVIFICGNMGMAKAVDTQLYEAVKLKQKIPFKAFKLYKQLIKNKTIVKQVFE